MINGDRVIALVPVRGGSKGIPRKNEENLGGLPLMAWPILAAKHCPLIDRVIASTEDCRLAKIGRDFSAEVYERPKELADDKTGLHSVILHLRETLRAEGEQARYMVLLEATSPFRNPEMIEQALRKLSDGADSVATFCQCKTHPHKAWKLSNEETPQTFIGGIDPWTRRQELSPAYELTGEIYAFDLNLLDSQSKSLLVGRSKALIIEKENCVDINEAKDLELARIIFDKSPLKGLNEELLK